MDAFRQLFFPKNVDVSVSMKNIEAVFREFSAEKVKFTSRIPVSDEVALVATVHAYLLTGSYDGVYSWAVLLSKLPFGSVLREPSVIIQFFENVRSKVPQYFENTDANYNELEELPHAGPQPWIRTKVPNLRLFENYDAARFYSTSGDPIQLLADMQLRNVSDETPGDTTVVVDENIEEVELKINRKDFLNLMSEFIRQGSLPLFQRLSSLLVFNEQGLVGAPDDIILPLEGNRTADVGRQRQPSRETPRRRTTSVVDDQRPTPSVTTVLDVLARPGMLLINDVDALASMPPQEAFFIMARVSACRYWNGQNEELLRVSSLGLNRLSNQTFIPVLFALSKDDQLTGQLTLNQVMPRTSFTALFLDFLTLYMFVFYRGYLDNVNELYNAFLRNRRGQGSPLVVTVGSAPEHQAESYLAGADQALYILFREATSQKLTPWPRVPRLLNQTFSLYPIPRDPVLFNGFVS